jgi:hypothetical protein
MRAVPYFPLNVRPPSAMILAADEVTPRAGQEGHEARDILGPAKPPDGNLGRGLLLCLRVGIALLTLLAALQAQEREVGSSGLDRAGHGCGDQPADSLRLLMQALREATVTPRASE